MTARLVVLASGSGTNLQAIIDACSSGALNAQVEAVVADRPAAFALCRASAHGIAPVGLPRRTREDRASYNARLRAVVAAYDPDWVVLAGFMRLLSQDFLDGFPDRVVNLHPALPGELPGVDAIERAYSEWTRGLRVGSGVMVHLVPDEGVDNGPLLAEAPVPFLPGDTLDEFAARVHATEHRLLVSTLRHLIAGTADPANTTASVSPTSPE